MGAPSPGLGAPDVVIATAMEPVVEQWEREGVAAVEADLDLAAVEPAVGAGTRAP